MDAATDLAKKANEQFVDDNFEYAVELYTQAIAIDPTKADLFADRAQANIKLGNFTGILFFSLIVFLLFLLFRVYVVCPRFSTLTSFYDSLLILF